MENTAQPTTTHRENRYGKPTTLRLKPQERAVVADILSEREHRTGRRATFAQLVRDLLTQEHTKRC